MPFDGIAPTVRHTRASALALYASAASVADLANAAHALAEALAPKPKASPPVADGLTAGTLTEALRLVCRVIQVRNSIPILAMARFHTEGGALHIRGTDLDNDLSTWIPAPGLELPPCVVPARDMLAVVSKLAKGSRVELGMERGPDEERKRDKGTETVFETSLVILAESGASWTIKGGWPGDFPDVYPGAGEVRPITADAGAWVRALEFAGCAMSTEETRYYLNGVCLRRFGLAVCAVATDGHRLHRHELVGAGAPPAAFAPMIIPYAAVGVILRLLDGLKGEVAIGFNAQKFSLETPTARIVGKLIDGSFPDVERVIPVDPPIRIQFDRKALTAAVAEVAAVNARTMERAVRLTFGRDVCHISAKSLDGGAAERAMPCDFPGHGFELGVNARYLLEALTQLGGETVTLGFGPGGAVLDPILITDADASRLAVLMPLRA